MAVVEVHEWFDRGGRENARLQREHLRTFLVKVDDPDDDATVVGAHDDIPQLGDAHPNDASTLVVDRECRPYQVGESLLYWLCLITYSNGVLNATGDKWKWQTGFLQKVSRSGYFYSNGIPDPDNPGGPPIGAGWSNVKVPYFTSAMGRFENPPEYEEPFKILTVTRGMSLLNYYVRQSVLALCLSGYDGQGSVNAAPFTYQAMTWAPGEVRLVDLQEEPATPEESVNAFVAVTYTFHLRRGGWQDELLDEDVAQLVVAGLNNQPQSKDNPGYYVRALLHDGNGKELTEPVPLDGHGRKLSIPGNLAFKDIPFVYLRFRKYDAIPYSLIGF